MQWEKEAGSRHKWAESSELEGLTHGSSIERRKSHPLLWSDWYPGLIAGVWGSSPGDMLSFSHLGAQVLGVGRPRQGSASTTTPTGSWSAPTRAAWSAARASRTSGCTATPPGATARAPSSLSRRAAGWTTSTATTGTLQAPVLC